MKRITCDKCGIEIGTPERYCAHRRFSIERFDYDKDGAIMFDAHLIELCPDCEEDLGLFLGDMEEAEDDYE